MKPNYDGPPSNPDPLRYGYEDPSTGLVFHSFNQTSKNKQRWVSKERFELMRVDRNKRRVDLYNQNSEYANKIKKYRSDLLLSNPDYAIKQKSYHDRTDVKEAKNKYITKLRRENHLFNLSHRIRSRLYSALKSNGITKKQKSSKYLGASTKTIKAFIEMQFDRGMSWENRSLWHIDHFFPLSMAKNQLEIRPLSHFSNLRPIWAAENRKKSKTIPSIGDIVKRNNKIESILKQIKQEHES